MFVEQLNGKYRTRFGVMDGTQNLRRLADGQSVDFVSHTDRVANANELPVLGEGTGLLGATRVNTPTGPVQIEELTVGQTILTAHDQQARLTHILPVARPNKTLRIRAPYFGANQDIIIAEEHYVEFTSEIAEYMFGEACVFVPAWALKDNSRVLHHELGQSDTMYQLQLDGQDTLGIGNCSIAAYHPGTKADGKKYLSDAEARSFVLERRIGQYN